MNLEDRVVVNGIYTGTVRYIGRVGTKKTPSLGIELDTPNGTNNGSLMGKFYFLCKPRHGVFKDVHEVKKYKAEEYNQTGLLSGSTLLSFQEIKEEADRIESLRNESLKMQRILEGLKQENLKLEADLAEERRKSMDLEQTLKKTEKEVERLGGDFLEGGFLKNDPFAFNEEAGQMHRTPQEIVLDLIKEVQNKIETEDKLFSV
ncbi:hypothetical protein NECID01_0882 [Nematocida sp. AWRm77]|nr:hypothetical protein NECID01_0882 [Nematocida sp. AWRm77]